MSTAAHYGALAVLHGGDDLTSPMLRELVPNVVTYFCLVRMLGTDRRSTESPAPR
jgi:hypothetical protein